MGILGPVVHILGSAMLDRGQHLAVRNAASAQPVGDDHPWRIVHALEYLAEEILGRKRVSANLNQYVEKRSRRGRPRATNNVADR